MIIRPATQSEFATAVEWAAAEGWNPGLDDLEPFFQADPNGFLMGFVDDEPAASISVVRYGADFGFLGFYIVAEKFRGQGLGWQIWQQGMEYLAGRCVGLDGVVAQQDNYRKSGFDLAYNNIRFTGHLAETSKTSPHIVQVSQADVPKIIEFDRAFFPAPRQSFLRSWIEPRAESRLSLAFLRDGEVEGFGTIRRCRDGFKVGPLVALTSSVAEELFLALAAHAKGNAVSLDVPQPNADALALAQENGLEASFETARMYRGEAPELPLSEIYGVTTFELG